MEVTLHTQWTSVDSGLPGSYPLCVFVELEDVQNKSSHHFFFLFLLLFLFFLLFSSPLFFLSPFSFRRGPSNALYPRATLQASLNTWCKAGFVVLLRATGFDVARRRWAPQLLPVLWQRAQVAWWYYRARDGSRSTLSALFRY